MKLLLENNKPTRFVPDNHHGFTVKALPRLELKDYTSDIIANLIAEEYGTKMAAKFKLKLKASELISALDWRIDRAKEREQLGLLDGETVADVLLEKEAIRNASNRLEQEADNLEDTEVMGLEFTVLDSDRPKQLTKTKLQFIRHIKEHGGISDADLLAFIENNNFKLFWKLFDIAKDLNVQDPSLLEALNAIDGLGYLPNGVQPIIDNW